ncbi:phosphate acyltransferase [Thalassoglobus sp.]|uniref:phosphate acyltransferase n=1 Tax=Thalassoglobus sp. TaxID=2795869 RepID=UPI003AA8C53C
MPLKSFEELYATADKLLSPIPVAAAGGADSTVIQALELARRRGWVNPILTGNLQAIRERADSLDVDISQFQLIEEEPNSARIAVKEVKEGRAQLLMKGQISTPYLMQAILDKEHGLRSGKTIGQIVLMEIARDQRSFLMTDTGVTIDPTIDQKIELIESVVDVAQKLSCSNPRIALMSATEKVTAALPDTQVADTIVQRASQGEFGECIVQGPLSFDLAYAVDAGVKKGIDGDVTGAADAMIFPNLLAANLTVKGIMYTAACQFGGILCGTTSPVVFMSRADSVETRLNSLAYALHLL